MPMVRSVLIKKEVRATNVSVQMEWLVIHTREVALEMNFDSQVNVTAIKTALTHWPAFKEHALAHAKVYSAVKMPIVSRKIMLLGVDAVLALLKMKMANVYRVCYFASFRLIHFFVRN